MIKSTEYSLWVIVLIIIATPIVYISFCSPGPVFWESVVSGLLATSAALVAGIPFALWIDRAIKHKDEVKNNKEERKLELELLELIKEELSFTNSLHVCVKGDSTHIPTQPLKSDLWASITTAGKLNLIQNHKLLNRIASAYYVINVVKKIEEQAYLASRSATVKFDNGRTAASILLTDARHFDTLLSESIDEALRDIDEDISKNT